MLKVGLTGSIAVGKTFVASVLRELGCHVLDADVTAREVVAAGSDGLREIVATFGESVLTPTGELDRKAMAAIVFADEDRRQLLNSIVHPRVIEAQNIWLEEVERRDPTGIAIIDAALIIESGGYRRLDKLIVVWCRPDIQLARLTHRDGLTEEDALRRISAQMPQKEKKSYSDFLIDTSNGFEDTRQQTVDVLAKLRKLES